MIRDEKEKRVAELNKVFLEAKGIYLTDFTGIDVKTINELRQEFKKDNINYQVVKNTITLLSIKDLPYNQLHPHLNGPTGLAYSYNNALLPGKVIDSFQKKTDLLPIKAAIIEGTVYEQEEAHKIIKLPPREELLAKMLGSLNTPISGFVGVLHGMIRNFVGVLDAIRIEKEKSEGAASTPEKGDAEEKQEAVKAESPKETPDADETAKEEQSADSGNAKTEETETPAVSEDESG